MKVKVLKIKDLQGRQIATLEALVGDVTVYANHLDCDGRYPMDRDEVIFDGFDEAHKLPTGKLRSLAMEAILDMFPTLYITDIRFGRVRSYDIEKYYSL